MIKYIILIITILFFTACVNKHGVSLKYYSDCKEYYDYQGYYHKECGDDDIVTYKKIGEVTSDGIDAIKQVGEEPKPKPNVW